MSEAATVEAPAPAPAHGISFGEALRVWVKVGLLSFGGPAGQIAVMHRILVDEKRWVSEERFLHALNYCMLLPGPEAQQLACYIGWLLHRSRGGIIAGALFVLPGFVSILALSLAYVAYSGTATVQALLYGLKPAIIAIVAAAVLRIGKRALKNGAMLGIAALAFLALFCFDAPFPIVIAAAGLVGWIGSRVRPDLFVIIKGHGGGAKPADGQGPALADDAAAHTPPSLAGSVITALVWLVLWWAPVLALIAALGTGHVLSQEGLFFSESAVVTFGGAYAVLAFIAQQAVGTYHWLTMPQMMDGLGMAETTPGPLIMVVQFVGFMGAFHEHGALDPYLAAIAASVLVTWVTFMPSYLYIFLGAPYIERLRGHTTLNAALSGITAAVVGVILNLACWFALHTLFAHADTRSFGPIRIIVPEWASVDWAATVLAGGACVAMLRFGVGMVWTLAVCLALGMAWSLAMR
jgi:chromate transporter